MKQPHSVLADLDAFVDRILAEDVGTGDITSNTVVPEGVIFHAAMAAREPLIVAGLPVAIAFIKRLAPDALIEFCVEDGDFAENIVTRGIDLLVLPVGTGLALGEVRLEITQIGKECHQRCAIYEQAGDCVMPKEGVFARVVTGGVLRAGDPIDPLVS